MRFFSSYRLLTAATVFVLLVGCSGNSATSPTPTSLQAGAHSLFRGVPGLTDPAGQPNYYNRPSRNLVGRYSCPATGPIEYMSDFYSSVVYVYSGRFVHQGPCGIIPQGVFFYPEALYVQPSTHDLYVANSGGFNILVFHRGQITPYNTYTDPTGQYPNDVAVASDGTVIASNYVQRGPNYGSLSTWIGGPNGGTFVGNFPMGDPLGLGEYITVDKKNTIYFNESRTGTEFWSVSCPAGACGTQTQIAGIQIQSPGGLAIDETGDLLTIDTNRRRADTFELPNPSPKHFHVDGFPNAMAISGHDNYLFVADPKNNDAAEYSYPRGILIGTVPGTSGGGQPAGIAIDP
jgi:DNA-binding beta-propeller fold protein YncE